MPLDWSTLLWLDWRLLRNRVRTVLRTPRRLVAWVVFAVVLTGGVALHDAAAAGPLPYAALLASTLGQLEPAVPGATLTVLGLLVWRGSATAPAAFGSAADAGYVIGAGIAPRTVLAWLTFRSLRRLAIAAACWALIAALYVPALGMPGHGIATVLAVALLLALLFGARMIVFGAARRAGWPRLDLAGLAVAVAGAGILGISLSPLAGDAPSALDALPPGGWLVEAARADALAMALLATTAAIAIAGGIVLAGDCVPELLHATRTARRPRRPSQARSVSGRLIPRGAGALLWKEWLSFRRGQGVPALQLGVMAGAIVLGTVVGLACSVLDGAVPFAVGYAAMLFALLANLTPVTLGAELRTPLWWLAVDALWVRLAVVSLARAARLSAPLIAFTCLVLTLGREPWWEAPMVVATEVVFSWLLQTLTAACYTVLPWPADARPAQVLRMLCLVVAFVPLSLALLPGAALNSVPLMLAGATLLMLGETAALLAIAARRLPLR